MRPIRDLREAAGITQQELADAMGVDRTTVTKWETGAASPAFSKIPKLADCLKCEISELFCSGNGSNG